MLIATTLHFQNSKHSNRINILTPSYSIITNIWIKKQHLIPKNLRKSTPTLQRRALLRIGAAKIDAPKMDA